MRPRRHEVVASEFCFSTPRIIMQRCWASITTPTPEGWIASSSAFADLDGEPLLHLETARDAVDEPRDLREPDDPPLGQVGDVALPEEGEHVVLQSE